MKLLSVFSDNPMLWSVEIPVALVFLLVIFLMVEARLPPEKKILRKFRKKD